MENSAAGRAVTSSQPSRVLGLHRSFASSRHLQQEKQQQYRWRRNTPWGSGGVQCRDSGTGRVDFQGSAGRAGAASFVTEPVAAGAEPGAAGGPDGSKLGRLGRMQQQLKALGLAGVLAYGLFNTIYYTCAFMFIWVYVAKVPTGQGIIIAARRFVEVFALTWVGSQMSKVPRAAGALLLAPAVDRGLGLLEHKLRLRSRQQAFLVVLGCCLAFALVLFCGVVMAWA